MDDFQRASWVGDLPDDLLCGLEQIIAGERYAIPIADLDGGLAVVEALERMGAIQRVSFARDHVTLTAWAADGLQVLLWEYEEFTDPKWAPMARFMVARKFPVSRPRDVWKRCELFEDMNEFACEPARDPQFTDSDGNATGKPDPPRPVLDEHGEVLQLFNRPLMRERAVPKARKGSKKKKKGKVAKKQKAGNPTGKRR